MQGSSAAGPAGSSRKMGLQNKQVSYTYILSYYIIYSYNLGCPPSQQWQMKFFFCDLLLKASQHIIIMVVTVTWQGGNASHSQLPCIYT